MSSPDQEIKEPEHGSFTYSSIDHVLKAFNKAETLMHTIPYFRSLCYQHAINRLNDCQIVDKNCTEQRNFLEAEKQFETSTCTPHSFKAATLICQEAFNPFVECLGENQNLFRNCKKEYESLDSCMSFIHGYHDGLDRDATYLLASAISKEIEKRRLEGPGEEQ